MNRNSPPIHVAFDEWGDSYGPWVTFTLMLEGPMLGIPLDFRCDKRWRSRADAELAARHVCGEFGRDMLEVKR